MKERPIILNTEMVRAVLDGRKTVTRRPWKKQPHKDQKIIWDKTNKHKSPFGRIGDKLWVRETWTYEMAGGHDLPWMAYKADCPYIWDDDGEELRCETKDFKWKPSIHMKKENARIWLEITDIRVERVQDITDGQCVKEGIYWDDDCPDEVSNGWCPGAYDSPLESFQNLWNSIYKNWDNNPWIWVVEFKVIEKDK